MKKSVRIITAIILAVTLLMPSTLALAYEAGDTVQWKNIYEDCGEIISTTIYYPTYKGEITTGTTEHGSLGNSDKAAFLFTADETGYYLFSGSGEISVSDRIVNEKPENFKDCFYLFNGTEYDFRTTYTAFYFEEGEQQYVMVSDEEDYGFDYGSINVAFAGEVEDIEALEEKTYLIDGNIWLYDYQEEPEAALEGIIDEYFIITFSDFNDTELYDSYICIKGTEELTEGENTVKLCEAEFEKEVTVNCYDIDSRIADVKKVDDTIYEDYEGSYNGNNDGFVITFTDGTTKTVAESETFEIDGIYFVLNTDYDCWYEEESDEVSVYYYSKLSYAYDSWDDFSEFRSYDQEATVKSLNVFQNFSILIERIRNEIDEYFIYLSSGYNPSLSNYLSNIRWHIYWFVQAI